MSQQQKRAALITKLAKRKEDQAAELLGQWRLRVNSQTDQLAELHRYQEAYLEAAKDARQSLYELQSNRQFLSQLGSVIQEQKQRLAHMQHQFASYCQRWQQLHQRRKMFENHEFQLAQREQQQLDKQWDRLCDELAARSFTAPQAGSD